MDSSTKKETNINNNKNIEIKKEEKDLEENNIINEIENKIRLKTDTNYYTEKKNKKNKNNVNNEKIVNNIRDMISMSKQINKSINKLNKKISNENEKIKKDNSSHKNSIILKYEDYKSNIRKYYSNIANKTKNKKIVNINKTNNIRTKNKLNNELISVEKMFKKYNSQEWDEIYKKRFKSYQDNINKKKEEMRKLKEKEKKKKEDEIIHYSNKKRPKSSRKKIFQNYKPLLIKENKYEKKSFTNYFKKMLERKNELDKKSQNEKIMCGDRYNEYIDKIKKISEKNKNLIHIKGKLYNLEEERKNLLEMSKKKNIFRSSSFKNIDWLRNSDLIKLNCNNSFQKNIISETDKLIYEFFLRYLEEKNIYIN